MCDKAFKFFQYDTQNESRSSDDRFHHAFVLLHVVLNAFRFARLKTWTTVGAYGLAFGLASGIYMHLWFPPV